jgi:uncharacterized membrane protein
MGENHFTLQPTLLYGIVLLLAAAAYFILQRLIVADHGRQSRLAAEIGRDHKGVISLVLYLAGIALTFWQPWAGAAIYALVAIMWLVPDKRVKVAMSESVGSE